MILKQTRCLNGASSIGLKRLESGALIKEYEDADKEVEQAIQMAVMNVISEDPRYVEKKAPPLEDEFPVDSKVIFLGEHAYGSAAQVRETGTNSLSVIIAVSPLLPVRQQSISLNRLPVLPIRTPGSSNIVGPHSRAWHRGRVLSFFQDRRDPEHHWTGLGEDNFEPTRDTGERRQNQSWTQPEVRGQRSESVGLLEEEWKDMGVH